MPAERICSAKQCTWGRETPVPWGSHWGECSYVIITKISSSNPCVKKQPLWPAGRHGSEFCRGRATFFLRQLPLFVRKVSQSRVHLRSLAVSRQCGQRSKKWSVCSFRKVVAAPQSSPGAAGLGGRPLGPQAAGTRSHSCPGAGSGHGPWGGTFLKPGARQG